MKSQAAAPRLAGGPSVAAPADAQAFAKFAWGLLAYMLFVILFGAWVRISGSGDGCGDHWPSCHGDLVPVEASTKTWIEYGHRVSSGVLGPLVIGLCVWAWVGAGKRSEVRWFAGLTLWFTLVEAGIGALLVRGRLVADDDSVARAVVVAWHLSNTLM
ncbi:MAG: hypothetical protein RJA70_914, partial [Pseudomonadota bacterium]